MRTKICSLKLTRNSTTFAPTRVTPLLLRRIGLSR
jgi:hypothetical protein